MQGLTVARRTAGTTTIDAETFEAFVAGQRGPTLTPGDDGYDAARVIWNGSIDRHPALIAQCVGAADVIDAVNFARTHDLRVAVRGGGHNVAGNAMNDDGIVIDLSLMTGVRVDVSGRTVRAEGGCTLGDVDRETQAFGLAAPMGVVSQTGIAGYTLCGGIGWLRRKHGMAVDALRSVDIVLADGQLVTASRDRNADLFWAVRGGGGNFGIVTSFEYELYPVGPTVNLCVVFYPLDENSADIVSAWVDFMGFASDDISSSCIFWTIPEHPAFPKELHGKEYVALAAMHSGPLDEGMELLQPLRELGEPMLDLSGQVPYVAAQTSFDPFFEKGTRRNYWKSLYLDGIDRAAIDRIVGRAKDRPDPWALIALWHLGGAMNRVDPSDTALGVRDASFLYSLDISWTDPADDESAIAWTREAWAGMRDYSNGGAYLNFPGRGEEGERLLRASYGSDNYDRLVDIKTKYDPDNLFRMNQNIEPRTS